MSLPNRTLGEQLDDMEHDRRMDRIVAGFERAAYRDGLDEGFAWACVFHAFGWDRAITEESGE